jgi:hypothetical protein
MCVVRALGRTWVGRSGSPKLLQGRKAGRGFLFEDVKGRLRHARGRTLAATEITVSKTGEQGHGKEREGTHETGKTMREMGLCPEGSANAWTRKGETCVVRALGRAWVGRSGSLKLLQGQKAGRGFLFKDVKRRLKQAWGRTLAATEMVKCCDVIR